MKKALIVLVSALLACCSTKQELATVSQYPVTQKGETVDTIFGAPVADPYRWLENDTAKATADWVTAQNDVTFGYLKNIPFRDDIRNRLGEIQNYEKLTAPRHEGGYIYYSRNSGLQNQYVQYRKKDNGGTEEVFLDPNTFSADGTTSLGGLSFSKDGSLVACQIQNSGSDWIKAVVLKTSDKSMVGDTLRNLKATGISWRGNEGFYYSSYDKPKGSDLSSANKFHKAYFHILGKPQSSDQLIYDGQKADRNFVGVGMTEDERFLVINTTNSTSGNDLFIQDLKDPKGKLIAVVNDLEHNHNVIDNDGTTFFVQTDLNAPNNRVVKFDLSKPTPENWKDVVPETEYAMQNASTAGRKIFVNYLKDACTFVKQFDYAGKLDHEIELPGIGSANGFFGKLEAQEIYYSFASFTTPTSIYKYSLASGKSELHAQPKVDFKPSDFEIKQVFYNSKDGTKVPMFIVYKKGTELNGKNATYLYAYGGFNISLTPSFSASRIVWLENGGVFAQPNLRGGGEYGEKWHDGGRLMNKQNVFDDFIAAGEYLIKEKYTSSEYLAVAGGSNGGLLVGATMTQRPDLMKVALPNVGVMDMLRYHKFTVGAGWAYDYGTSDDSKEMFEYLKKYSPLNALTAGTKYPATLVTTADHDDRVVPSHSFKFAAALQVANTGNNPELIRIDTKSGHGASNLSKALDVQADMYAFTWYNMGIIPPLAKKSL